MKPVDARLSSVAVGIACGAGAALFWAAGFVAARHGVDAGFTPADLTFHRCFWAGLAAAAAGLARRLARSQRRRLGPRHCADLLRRHRHLVCQLFRISAGAARPRRHHPAVHARRWSAWCWRTVVLRERLPPAARRRRAGHRRGPHRDRRRGLHHHRHAWRRRRSAVRAGRRVLRDLRHAAPQVAASPPTRAMVVVSVVSLAILPVYAALIGFERMAALGFRENLLQAVMQGLLAGPGAIYLFTRSVILLGASRAAVFPTLVPPCVLLIGWLALGIQRQLQLEPRLAILSCWIPPDAVAYTRTPVARPGRYLLESHFSSNCRASRAIGLAWTKKVFRARLIRSSPPSGVSLRHRAHLGLAAGSVSAPLRVAALAASSSPRACAGDSISSRRRWAGRRICASRSGADRQFRRAGIHRRRRPTRAGIRAWARIRAPTRHRARSRHRLGGDRDG